MFRFAVRCCCKVGKVRKVRSGCDGRTDESSPLFSADHRDEGRSIVPVFPLASSRTMVRQFRTLRYLLLRKQGQRGGGPLLSSSLSLSSRNTHPQTVRLMLLHRVLCTTVSK